MKEQLPHLSPDSRALLDSGRAPEAVPAEVETRLWGQISNALLVAPSIPQPQAPRLVPDAPTVVAGGKTLALVKLGCAILGVAGAGAAIVLAAGHMRRGLPARGDGPAAALSSVAPPGLPPAPSIAAQGPTQSTEPVARPKQPTIARPYRSPQQTREPPPQSELAQPTDHDLNAERSLIADARSALQRGAPLEALATLRTHAERFRAGSLAEERDALRIQALAASGDRAGAEAAAAQFIRTYPHGLMGPAVRATLRGEP